MLLHVIQASHPAASTKEFDNISSPEWKVLNDPFSGESSKID